MDQCSKDERIFTSAFALITTNFTYDLGCNMTSDGRFTYYWNGENRMVCASNDEVVVTYAYDHRGRMVRKNISHRDTEPQRIEYLWDGWNIIREKLATNDYALATNDYTLTSSYVWGLDLDGTMQGAGGVGGLIAVVRDDGVFLPAYDANGNITEYVSTSGDTVAHYEYSAFGEPTVSSGELASSFTHQFSTKPYCATTGFSEYVYRKCRPVIGRWMSRDPIENESFIRNRDRMLNIKLDGVLKSAFSKYNLKRYAITDISAYMFVSNCGICNIDVLGLMGEADERDQVCNNAEQELHPRANGNLICHNGKPYACAWNKNDEMLKKYPKVKECTQKHEDTHLGQNVANACCGTKGTFIPDYPGGLPEKNKSECEAYNVSVECLKKSMIDDCGVSFNSGYNPFTASECIRYYDFKLDSAINSRNSYCKKAKGM